MKIIKNVRNTPYTKNGYRNKESLIDSLKGKYKLSKGEINLILALFNEKESINDSLEASINDYLKLYKYKSIQPTY